MTLIVKFKDDREDQEIASVDGGGSFIGSGEYEVHGFTVDGGNFCESQNDIESIVDSRTGEQVEWGNPYFPGHPDYSEEKTNRILKEMQDVG